MLHRCHKCSRHCWPGCRTFRSTLETAILRTVHAYYMLRVSPVQVVAARVQRVYQGSKVELRGCRLEEVESSGVSWVGR